MHSTPHFPSATGSKKFYFPETETKYGQTYLCFHLPASEVKAFLTTPVSSQPLSALLTALLPLTRQSNHTPTVTPSASAGSSSSAHRPSASGKRLGSRKYSACSSVVSPSAHCATMQLCDCANVQLRDCATMQVDKVANQLLYTRPYIYKNTFSSAATSSYPNLKKVARTAMYYLYTPNDILSYETSSVATHNPKDQ